MKYQQKDFTEELRSKIKNIELAFEKHIEKILNENKTALKLTKTDDFGIIIMLYSTVASCTHGADDKSELRNN